MGNVLWGYLMCEIDEDSSGVDGECHTLHDSGIGVAEAEVGGED